MVTLDLDAKRAARSEAENAPHELVLGGETFTLPPRLPLAFLDHLTAMEFAPAMRALLGEQWAAFAAHDPDVDDLMEIASQLYGMGDFFVVSPPPSPASSANGGRPSRRTGKPTTTGTSRRTATDRPTSGPASSSPS